MGKIQKGIGIAEKLPEPDPDEMARQSLKKIKNKFIVKCSDAGVSYQENYRDSSITKAFAHITENILKRCG